MPIKPVYVERILSGQKLFEFRRTSIRQDTTHLILYSSSPVKRIMGVAEVSSILTASPTVTWERTKHAAGISRRLFREYFKGSKKASAIEIQSVFTLNNPLAPHEIIPKFHIPQSYRYVDSSFLEKVIQQGSR
jgi:predicted transcriptional regulator